MGVATEKLSPPHNYVPWIVVDGEHTEALGKHVNMPLKGTVQEKLKFSQ